MEKYNLNAEEWFFTQLIFLGHEEEGQDELIKKYISKFNGEYPINRIFNSLRDKGVILKSCKLKEDEKLDCNKIEINSLFYKNYMKHSGILGEELYANYPLNVFVNGVRHSLRNIAKKWNSKDDFCYAYSKIIRFDPLEHQRIMTILDRAKEANIINFGIKIQVLLYSNI